MTDQVEGYRLSFQQQRLWRLAERGVASWAQLLLAVDGEVDPSRLRAALEDTMGQQEILRSTYQPVPGMSTALLVVEDAKHCSPQWSQVDLQLLDDEAQQHRIGQTTRAQRDLPHARPDGPVLRAVLFGLGPRRQALLLSTSALAADDRTLRLLGDALARNYEASVPTTEILQYNQFSEWQHRLSEEQEGAASTDRLRVRTTLPFPLRRPRGAARPDRRDVTSCVPEDTAQDVHAYARSRRVRPASVLLAAWQVLLGAIAGVGEMTVGTLIDGRDHQETLDGFGPYATWVGVSARLRPELTFDDLAVYAETAASDAQDEREDTLAAHAEDVEGWDLRFACHEVPEPSLNGGEVAFTVAWADVESESYGLKLHCVLEAGRVLLRWHYDGTQFGAAYVRVLAGQYSWLLAQLLASPTTASGAIRLPALAEGLRDRPETPAGRCLHRLVEQQVERTPDAVAVVSGTERLTYRQLDAQADAWAGELRARGIGLEARVAVSVGHSAALLVALLAVLKAGGAYVPLDPDLPPLRVRDLLTQAGCRLLLTDCGVNDDAARDGVPGVQRLDLRDLPRGGVGAEGGHPPGHAVGPDNLAYVIFTSGSSGLPKGVMLPHRAVCNYLLWCARTYTADDGSALGGAMVHSSIAFDLTFTSLFLPLVTGGTVHVDPAWRDPLALSADVAGRRDLGLLKLTPSHLMVVNHVTSPDGLADTVGCLVLGGEPLTGEAVSGWLEAAPRTRIFNEYGPTETAVGICVHEVGAGDGRGPVPIGRAIDHTEVLVLDDGLEPVAVGVPGEIYIGGEALARGYLGSPAATAERFLPHPSCSEPGRRLYRTGDLACLGPNGCLHYLGRLDSQVKIRGVRVEPEEIRAALLGHPGVREAAVDVVIHPESGVHLVAYVVGRGDEAKEGVVSGPGPQALREFLADRLPAEMLPQAYVRLDAIPLTRSGKVDRGALPAARRAALATDPVAPVAPPGDAVEAAVAGVFETLIGVAPVGPEDDFFGLGGHSLLALRLVAQLGAEFGVELPVSVLFAHVDAHGGSPASPRRLARSIDAARTAASFGATTDPPVLVALQTHGAGAPLFCVHPAGGEIIGFRGLAGPGLQRPLYALQASALEHDAAPSIEDLAGQYLAAIRAVQPAGPYLLLGWSMGGLVALELARRLEREGERTDMLFLVESYLSGQLPEPNECSVDGPAADHVFGADERLPLTSDERNRLAVLQRLDHAHLLAARHYRPAPYAGPVTLVQAREQDPQLLSSATQAWLEVCEQPLVTRHVLDGGHLTLLQPPHVDALLQVIERAAEGSRDPEAQRRERPGPAGADR